MCVFHCRSSVSGMWDVFLGLTLPFSGASSFLSLLISHGRVSFQLSPVQIHLHFPFHVCDPITHTHTTSPTKHCARKLRRAMSSKCCIVNWSGGLGCLGVGIFFPCQCFMCGCCKVLERGVFITGQFCDAPGPRLDPGCWGQVAVLLHWLWGSQRQQSCLLRLFREFRVSLNSREFMVRGSLTMQQRHNTTSALSSGLCEERG